MAITKSEFKQEIQAERAKEFGALLGSRSKRANDGDKLPLSRLASNDFSRRHWVATISNKTLYEDLFKPAFWQHVADRFKLGDLVEARDDSLSYWSLLLVTGSDPVKDFVQMTELMKKELPQAVVDQGSDVEAYSWKYEGLQNGYSVIRKADNQVVAKNFKTELDARSAIRDLKITRIT